jgi:hypothetical protein
MPELSREYLEIRNEQMRTKNLTAQMELAIRKGQLIEKRLVERQAAFLLVAMKQKILNQGPTYARRLTGLHDIRAVRKILDQAAISVLNELKDLPSKVTDPTNLRPTRANKKPISRWLLSFNLPFLVRPRSR